MSVSHRRNLTAVGICVFEGWICRNWYMFLSGEVASALISGQTFQPLPMLRSITRSEESRGSIFGWLSNHLVPQIGRSGLAEKVAHCESKPNKWSRRIPKRSISHSGCALLHAGISKRQHVNVNATTSVCQRQKGNSTFKLLDPADRAVRCRAPQEKKMYRCWTICDFPATVTLKGRIGSKCKFPPKLRSDKVLPKFSLIRSDT